MKVKPTQNLGNLWPKEMQSSVSTIFWNRGSLINVPKIWAIYGHEIRL